FRLTQKKNPKMPEGTLGFGNWDLGVGICELPARFLTPSAAATTATAPAAATTASTEPAAAVAAAARLLRTRFIDRQRTAAEALLVELCNRILRVLVGGHFDEREAA